MRPLCIDLCCGLGGWARGFLDAGYDVIGFDVEILPYPGHLVLQDVRTLDGRRFRGATVIVASPPCQEFSRLTSQWTRAVANPNPDLSIVEACRRIANEARVPLVLENVKGAQPFLGRSEWRYGSQYLWGDGVPLLRPIQVPRGSGKRREVGIYGRRHRSRERAIIPYPLSRFVAEYHR